MCKDRREVLLLWCITLTCLLRDTSAFYSSATHSFTATPYSPSSPIPFSVYLRPLEATLSMNIFNTFVSGYDEKKENSRRYRRTIYSAPDWRRHRSSGRHFSELLKMPSSNVLRGVFPQSLFVAFFATFVYAYNYFLLKTTRATFLPLLAFPPLPFSLTSPSLGLLLVFRTNAAYSRWKDSRIAWASISSKSFNLMRQGCSYFTDRKLATDLIKYTTAFSYGLKFHLGQLSLTAKESLEDDLQGILNLAEMEDFLKAKNKPQRALLEITRILQKAELIASIQSHMDKSVCELSDAFFVCDRIYTTPIPLFYTRHTARFLLIWLMTVPMALYSEFKVSKWAIIPISALNALFLFGIEELGVQIEEPFSILPMYKTYR